MTFERESRKRREENMVVCPLVQTQAWEVKIKEKVISPHLSLTRRVLQKDMMCYHHKGVFVL